MRHFDDKKIRCPFDRQHVMPLLRFQYHNHSCETKFKNLNPGTLVLHCPNNYRHIFFDKAKLEAHLPSCEPTNIGQTLELFVEESSKRNRNSSSKAHGNERSRSRETERAALPNAPSSSLVSVNVRGSCRESGSSLKKVDSQIFTASKVSKHRSMITRGQRSKDSNSESDQENVRPNASVLPASKITESKVFSTAACMPTAQIHPDTSITDVAPHTPSTCDKAHK